MDNRPIGFFDSGIGGTCILDAFLRRCPDESTVYIADSAHCPYGNRPAEEIRRLAERCVKRLLRRNCKVIVVACNTATAAAIDYLRDRYDVPFVGLEPAVKPAVLKSKSGIVGVLATAGTFGGRLYRETKEKFAKGATVIAAMADEFVEIVEDRNGRSSRRWTDERVAVVVRSKILPLVAAGADKIVLGCTHFPHLRSEIEAAAGDGVEVIDPSEAVARQVERVLIRDGLRGSGKGAAKHVYISTLNEKRRRG